MSTGKRVLKGGALLGAGQVAAQGLSLVRNAIVARLLSPADFGVAATFAMTMAFVEMASNFEPSTLLIQAKDGDESRLQDAAHAVELVRALINSLMLLLLAWPLAALFHVRQARWAFFVLSAVPLLRGLGHLDRMRVQRDLVYWPYVTIEVTTHLVLALVAWPLAAFLRDYSVMLWLLIGQSLLIAAGAHLLAKRKYRWNWRKSDMVRFYSFGWPLLLNGFLMFGILQGDRAVIGFDMTMTDLGIYSVGLTLTLMPATLIFRVVGPIVLPLLARVQHDQVSFAGRYKLCAGGLAVCGLAMSVPLIVSGGPLVVLLFGSQYSAVGAFIGWLALAQFFRILRGAPTTAALAFGDTHNQLVSNFVRASAIPIIFVVAILSRHLAAIAFVSAVAEAIALGVSLFRLSRRHSVDYRSSLAPFSGALLIIGIAAAVHRTAASHLGAVFEIGLGGLLMSLSVVAFVSVDATLRREAMAYGRGIIGFFIHRKRSGGFWNSLAAASGGGSK